MADPTIIDVTPTNHATDQNQSASQPKREWFRRRNAKKNPDLIEVCVPMDGVKGLFRVVQKHPAWYRFLLIMLVIGGPSIFGWIYAAGFLHGNGCMPNVRSCFQSVAANAPPAVKPDQSPPSQQVTTQDLAKDLAELQSLIEKLAEPKPDAQPAPASTATASATAAAATVQTNHPPTPTTMILKVPDPVPVKVVGQPPPQPQVQVQPPKSDAEERNEALFKRLRCKYHKVCN